MSDREQEATRHARGSGTEYSTRERRRDYMREVRIHQRRMRLGNIKRPSTAEFADWRKVIPLDQSEEFWEKSLLPFD